MTKETELKAMNTLEQITEAEALLKQSRPVYDFSGFKVFENSMMPENEIYIVCGSKIYKQVIEDSTSNGER